MSALDSGRYSVAAGCVGICQGCVDASVRYSQEREQFGRPIAGFQLVQAMIADMVVETDASRMLVWRAGYLKDAGSRAPRETSIAKLYATEAAVRSGQHGDPGPRRLGLRRRPPRRALLPRRAGDDAVRGHLPDPEADHRARGDRDQRAGAGLSQAVAAPQDDRRRRRRHDGRGHRAARLPGGARTLLHDPVPEALERGLGAIRRHLDRGVERGRLTAEDRDEARARLERRPPSWPRLWPCELVIEAAPEQLELKRELFASWSPDRRPTACSPRTPRRCSSPRSPPAPRTPSASWGCTSSTRRR